MHLYSEARPHEGLVRKDCLRKSAHTMAFNSLFLMESILADIMTGFKEDRHCLCHGVMISSLYFMFEYCLSSCWTCFKTK